MNKSFETTNDDGDARSGDACADWRGIRPMGKEGRERERGARRTHQSTSGPDTTEEEKERRRSCQKRGESGHSTTSSRSPFSSLLISLLLYSVYIPYIFFSSFALLSPLHLISSLCSPPPSPLPSSSFFSEQKPESTAREVERERHSKVALIDFRLCHSST